MPSAFQRAKSFAKQTSSFIHQRMLEGTGVGVQHGCFEAQLSSGLAPARDGGENFAEDSFRFSGLETKTRSRCQRSSDGGFLLILSDRSFAPRSAVHLRHRVEIVGRRERPPSRFAHQETVVAEVVVVVAGKKRQDKASPQFAEVASDIVTKLTDAISHERVRTHITL